VDWEVIATRLTPQEREAFTVLTLDRAVVSALQKVIADTPAERERKNRDRIACALNITVDELYAMALAEAEMHGDAELAAIARLQRLRHRSVNR
jgi:hypothetical protein